MKRRYAKRRIFAKIRRSLVEQTEFDLIRVFADEDPMGMSDFQLNKWREAIAEVLSQLDRWAGNDPVKNPFAHRDTGPRNRNPTTGAYE